LFMSLSILCTDKAHFVLQTVVLQIFCSPPNRNCLVYFCSAASSRWEKTISVKQCYISFTLLNMPLCNDCLIWMHRYKTLCIGISFENLPEFPAIT
jgi:hypothetical protein